jgi:hypothetical protein
MSRRGTANLNDDRFVAAALEPGKRRELIGKLERMRNVATWMMALGALSTLVVLWSDRPKAAFGGVLVVLLGSITFGQADSKLKLLKVLAKQEAKTEPEDEDPEGP